MYELNGNEQWRCPQFCRAARIRLFVPAWNLFGNLHDSVYIYVRVSAVVLYLPAYPKCLMQLFNVEQHGSRLCRFLFIHDAAGVPAIPCILQNANRSTRTHIKDRFVPFFVFRTIGQCEEATGRKEKLERIFFEEGKSSSSSSSSICRTKSHISVC